MTPLGEALRFARKSSKKALLQIEAESGISNAYLSQLETGKFKRPNAKKLEALASAYGLRYELLLILGGYQAAEGFPVNLPAFVIEAGEVLQAEDWELLRGLIAYLVAARTTARPVSI